VPPPRARPAGGGAPGDAAFLGRAARTRHLSRPGAEEPAGGVADPASPGGRSGGGLGDSDVGTGGRGAASPRVERGDGPGGPTGRVRAHSVPGKGRGPGRAGGGGSRLGRGAAGSRGDGSLDGPPPRAGSPPASPARGGGRRRPDGGDAAAGPGAPSSRGSGSSGWPFPRRLPGDDPDMPAFEEDARYDEGGGPGADAWADANERLRGRAPAAAAGQAYFRPVTYAEGWDVLSARPEVDALRGTVRVADEPGGGCGGAWQRLLRCLLVPDLSDPALAEERELLFCVARTPLGEADEFHSRVLATCWQLFTGARDVPARFGAHWEALGFQREDPATDLRAAGLLGLLHLLHLGERSPGAARDMAAAAQDGTAGFPLAVVSINATKWAMDALRQGRLNALALRHGSVARVAALFHAGAVYEFVARWRAGGHTMLQSGFVMKEMEAHAKANPADMVGRALGQGGGS